MKKFFLILVRTFYILKKIISSKIEIKKPEKVDILIWGRPSFGNIFKEKNFNYLKRYKINYLDVWGESYNFKILLRCLLRLDISFLNYANEFIKLVNPSIILSFLDNYKLFYLLKKNKNQKKFLIQSAYRSNEFGTFNSNKPLKSDDVDYLFCHNKNIKKVYSKITKAKIFISGSFLSNNVPIKKVKKKYDILYVSTFRLLKNNLKINGNVTLKDYLDAESNLIDLINSYCLEEDKKLYILPTRKRVHNEEYNFFKESIKKNKNWKFIKRTSFNYDFPYKIIDQAKIVIGIDSTLLYEAFSRGVKTIFCDIRPNNKFLSKTRHFAWPKKLKASGPFWLSKINYKDLIALINNVSNYSNFEWSKIFQKYRDDLMPYDKNNKIFKNILSKYLKKKIKSYI